MKRRIALLLVAIMIAALLVGCGSSQQSAVPAAAEQKTEAKTETTQEAEPLTFKWASQNNPVMASGQASLFTVKLKSSTMTWGNLVMMQN